MENELIEAEPIRLLPAVYKRDRWQVAYMNETSWTLQEFAQEKICRGISQENYLITSAKHARGQENICWRHGVGSLAGKQEILRSYSTRCWQNYCSSWLQRRLHYGSCFTTSIRKANSRIVCIMLPMKVAELRRTTAGHRGLSRSLLVILKTNSPFW